MTQKELAGELACNCCNGRVGRQLAELATQVEGIRKLVAPTGIEILRAASEAGIAAREACNCCNGRVGNQELQDLVATLGGG